MTRFLAFTCGDFVRAAFVGSMTFERQHKHRALSSIDVGPALVSSNVISFCLPTVSFIIWSSLRFVYRWEGSITISLIFDLLFVQQQVLTVLVCLRNAGKTALDMDSKLSSSDFRCWSFRPTDSLKSVLLDKFSKKAEFCVSSVNIRQSVFEAVAIVRYGMVVVCPQSLLLVEDHDVDVKL